ncbi:MAG: nicotinamide-nucleotide amidohydrolase family protein [Puniceicoccales bacterium]|jgi:nicotinamide-nucleotide amidase|nr:nicotinamide-nucleotide amidohydrolase family protein [Puniceicoccales bacterium]
MQKQELTPCKVDLINIGDELLDGLCENNHLRLIGEQVARAGHVLRRSAIVRDDDGGLASEFSRSWAEADVVITTGGMGPRYDDLTRETISRQLGKRLVYDKKAEALLIDRLKAAGRPVVNSSDLTQCWILEGSELLPNLNSNAPGILYRDGAKILIMLPGDVNAVKALFAEFISPLLRKMSRCPEGGEPYVQIRTFGSTINVVEDKIRPLIDKTRVKFVTGERHGMVDIRLMSGQSGFCCKQLLETAKQVREIMGEEFVCTGHDRLSSIVLEQLKALEATIGVAESCTGGLLSGALTEVPGASKCFAGGGVVYSKDLKGLIGAPEEILNQHGEVSAECAVALAVAAAERFGSDYGLSVTGYAGPDGGTTGTPVGTVFVGYSSPQGEWASRFFFRGNRHAVRAQAVNAALDLVRRKLNKYRVKDVLLSV